MTRSDARIRPEVEQAAWDAYFLAVLQGHSPRKAIREAIAAADACRNDAARKAMTCGAKAA